MAVEDFIDSVTSTMESDERELIRFNLCLFVYLLD